MTQEKKLKEILDSKAFEQLHLYHDPAIWDSLSSNEKELLALLFVKQGEHLLINGDATVFENFKKAETLAPTSALIYLHKAMAYATQDENIRCLEAAAKCLEKVVHLDPNLPAAWHGWGFVNVKKGVFFNDVEFFYDADKKFHEAEHHARILEEQLPVSFYFDWAICWHNVGRHSGEAVDYFRALEKLRLAQKAGCSGSAFHAEFGKVLEEMASLVESRRDLFIEATEHYKLALKDEPQRYESLIGLAMCLLRLYDSTGNKEYFDEADQVFHSASEIGYDDPMLWMRWGEIFILSGRLSRDIEKIQLAISKFETALTFEPNEPHVLLRWAEAEILLGAYSESLELLQEAKHKVIRCIERLPKSADAWYIYGLCLSEFGRYFHDKDYYIKAVEAFENGLTLNSRHLHLMHATAMAYYAVGEMTKDLQIVKKASELCSKVAESHPNLPATFYNDWGVVLLKIGEISNDQSSIEAAAEKFEKAISKRHDLSHIEDIELEWLYNYGCALDFLGDFHDEPVYYEKAIQVLSHIIQVDPDYLFAKFNLALAYYHLGDLNADVECLNHSIHLFHEIVLEEPEDELAWNDYGMAVLSLAVLINDPVHTDQVQQLFSQAEAKFLRAIALGNTDAYYNLGCLYSLTHNYPAAIHYLEKAEQNDGIPSADALINDEWLENLRNNQAFRQIVSRMLNDEVDGCDD